MATVLLGSESSVAAKTAASNAVSTSMLLPLAGPKRCIEAEGHPLLQRSPEHHFAPHTIQAHTWRQVGVG